MKKKAGYKILSIMLCFMCLFFVGCGNGGPSDGDDSGYQSSVDGVKVLARTTDENYFSTATGEFSEYYYNIFASEILDNLYSIYENYYFEKPSPNILLENVNLNKNDGETFTTFTGDNKYYLYDSLRYTINDITIKKDASDNITDYVVTLDLNSAWDWDADYDVEGREIIFNGLSFIQDSDISISNDKILSVSLLNAITNEDIVADWKEIYSKGYIPSFSEIYAGTERKIEGKDYTNYFTSPYYLKNVEGASADGAKNFYQDALEYATYLFVLGYDYENERGEPSADALKFQFEIIDAEDGTVQDIKVGGLSIETALANVKAEYKKNGNFVGITETNKQQIKRFVLDKIIGDNAFAKNTFDVTISTTQNGSTTSQTLSFNRNYDAIVEYVIDYACEQAPIGVDGEGNQVNLDNAYLASTITDYKGEYFFAADDGEGNMFRYIDAAEYQSMVFFPLASDVGKRLTDIRLAFEYDDYAGQALSAADEGLSLYVGLRYFDSESGTYTYLKQAQITVEKGENLALTEFNPDLNTMHFTEDELLGSGTVKIDEDIIIGSQFKNPDAINPAKYSTEPESQLASMTIKGNSTAREYYKLFNSNTTGGSYGALNGEMFKNGDGACDFVEVYFDIQKGRTDVSYNFKVAVDMYYTMDADLRF